MSAERFTPRWRKLFPPPHFWQREFYSRGYVIVLCISALGGAVTAVVLSAIGWPR